jgi:enoyl-CoA hydratase/carnithine racemase
MSAVDDTLPSVEGAPLEARLTGGVLTLTLHRPSVRNALTRELILDLTEALRAASQEPDCRLIVLTGAGENFCSGADLLSIRRAPREEVPARLDEFQGVIRSLLSAPQPVLAAVDGAAVGFGADLAMAADLRIMTERAFLEPSFARVGLMPDGGGTHWAPTYLGARAFEVLALGARLSAARCLELGLTSEVVPLGELEQAIARLGAALLDAAPLALTALKRALRDRTQAPLEAALAREKLGQTRLLSTADFDEGVASFLQKRTPRFIGR